MDVIKSISGLLKISTAIKGAFFGLTILFGMSLIISSGLSVSSYVQKNEKSIAIVKAFGGKLRHINFLLFSQTLLLFINAFAFTLVLFLIVKFFALKLSFFILMN
jgi:predicted lysophospholipase L1 biosynthesis ABC-type transport system permease subunit